MRTSDGWIDVGRRNDPVRAGVPETLELVRQRLGDPAGDDPVLGSYDGWPPEIHFRPAWLDQDFENTSLG